MCVCDRRQNIIYNYFFVVVAFIDIKIGNNDWIPDPFNKNRHHHYQLPSSSSTDLSFGDLSSAQGIPSTHNNPVATLLVNSTIDKRDDQPQHHVHNDLTASVLNVVDHNIRSVSGTSGPSPSNNNVGNRINLVSDTNELLFSPTNIHGINNAQTSCTNGNFLCHTPSPIITVANVDAVTLTTTTTKLIPTPLTKQNSDFKKPRMIAEVKPMRMSYSDVLSKNVFNKEISETHMYNNRNSSSATTLLNGSTNSNVSQKPNNKMDKLKNSPKENSDKKSFGYHDEINKETALNYKAGTKSSIINNATMNATSNTKSNTASDVESTKPNDVETKQTKKKIATNNNSKNSNRNAKNSNSEPFLSKRRSQSDLHATNSKDDLSDSKSSQNNGYFYNITKNDTSQPDRSFSTYSKVSQQKKSASNKSSSVSSSSSSMNRNSSNRIDKSTVHQQKRNNKSRKNNPYELIWKLLNAWFNYMIFFFKWLIALVCDVFMLSFGIMWDRFSSAFEYSCQIFTNLRSELTNNSGRPFAYFINLWTHFDGRFNKDSKWAIWRRLFLKKKPPEPMPDYYKNGRLPQTGDEAMYSLLNCKGKDAYRYVYLKLDSINLFFFFNFIIYIIFNHAIIAYLAFNRIARRNKFGSIIKKSLY